MKSGRFVSFRHQSRPSSTSSSSFSLMAVATEWRFFSSSSSTPTSSSVYQAFTTSLLTELRMGDLFFIFIFFSSCIYTCVQCGHSVSLTSSRSGSANQVRIRPHFLLKVYSHPHYYVVAIHRKNGLKAQMQQKAVVLTIRKADTISWRSSARAGGRPEPAV